MKDIRDNARHLMKGFCRVCRESDGRSCVGEVPGMGGIGTASSFSCMSKGVIGCTGDGVPAFIHENRQVTE